MNNDFNLSRERLIQIDGKFSYSAESVNIRGLQRYFILVS